MKLIPLLFISLSFISTNVIAHGPTPQKADESIIIDASLEKTWGVLKEFHQIANWHPDVKFSLGDGNNVSDSVRSMTLNNEGVVEESLDYYSEKDHEYNYRLKGLKESIEKDS